MNIIFMILFTFVSDQQNDQPSHHTSKTEIVQKMSYVMCSAISVTYRKSADQVCMLDLDCPKFFHLELIQMLNSAISMEYGPA